MGRIMTILFISSNLREMLYFVAQSPQPKQTLQSAMNSPTCLRSHLPHPQQ